MFMDTVNIRPEDILIKVQDTPNPQALKFIINQVLKSEGKATFIKAEECNNLPLIYALVTLKGVKQVYIFRNTLSVTFTKEINKEELISNVQIIIKTRINIHNPDFLDYDPFEKSKPKVKKKHESDNVEIQKINEILDRTVRPALQADGGDIEVIEFLNDEVKILYQGACGGCPSSLTGTLQAIENILQNELNQPNLKVSPL